MGISSTSMNQVVASISKDIVPYGFDLQRTVYDDGTIYFGLINKVAESSMSMVLSSIGNAQYCIDQ